MKIINVAVTKKAIVVTITVNRCKMTLCCQCLALTAFFILTNKIINDIIKIYMLKELKL